MKEKPMNDIPTDAGFVSGVRKAAADSFAAGLYCAESVVRALAQAQGVDSDLPTRAATAFCSGISRSCGTCGALTGAIMGISLRLGRSAPEDTVQAAYAATQRLIGEFEQAFGARECHVLLGCDLGTTAGQATFREKQLGQRCAHYTASAAAMAARILAEDGSRPLSGAA